MADAPEGFVVLAAAARGDDVARARSLLWDAIEACADADADGGGGGGGVRRDAPASWANARDDLIDMRGQCPALFLTRLSDGGRRVDTLGSR